MDKNIKTITFDCKYDDVDALMSFIEFHDKEHFGYKFDWKKRKGKFWTTQLREWINNSGGLSKKWYKYVFKIHL